jgi:predicted CoA-binding protein
MNDLETARRILGATRSIAVVGASERPERDSHRVMQYLLRQGFVVYPVNPNARRILDQTAYARLTEIPASIDTVVCFRRSEYLLPITRDLLAAGAKHLWMQLGVVNEEASDLACQEGVLVVMNRCIMTDHRRFSTLHK